MKRIMAILLLSTLLVGCKKTENDISNYEAEVLETEALETTDKKDTTLTIKELEKNIEAIANAVLNDKLSITININEKVINIFYEGNINGGSEQTQESVQKAFDAVKTYLNEIGFSDYFLRICSYETYPVAQDKLNEKKDDDEQNSEIPTQTTNTSYTHIGEFPAGPVFELISTAEDATTDAELAIKTLTSELPNENNFFFCVFDESEKFLGEGSKNGYIPYTFNKNDNSPEIPFEYYFIKYFSDIKTDGYAFDDGFMVGGVREYKFEINAISYSEKEKCRVAIEKIHELMSLSLGNDVNVKIKVYADTGDEICVQTFEESPVKQ